MRAVKIIILAFFTLLVFAFPALAFPLEIKDSTGYPSYFVQPPTRIISAMPSITEMLFALGLGQEIKGVTFNCNYPLEAKLKPKIGRETINLEKVVSLHPHLIVMLEDAQKLDIERLRKFGLPVFAINPHNINDVKKDLTLLGQITSHEAQAAAVVEQMNERLNRVKDQVKHRFSSKKKVLVVVGLKPLVVVGPKTFIDDILAAAGVSNAAAKAKGPYPFYSMEELVINSPDNIVIIDSLVKDAEQLYSDSQWNKIPAVRDKKVLVMDADIISRPGPRLVEAVEKIARFVYNP